MNYLRRHLMPNEQLVAQTELHWIIFFSTTIYSCLFLIYLAYRPKGMPAIMDIGGFIFIVILWLNVLIRYLNTEYAISKSRILMKQGFIQTRTYDLLVSRIESVQLHQSLLAKIFGYGTVVMTGTGGDQIRFIDIADVVPFYQKVLEQNQMAKV
jgi:uncharacterized membrane protein YdbT with pleckstrin-like domain